MNRGYGKIILLGEHFVVHGLPALVTALDLVTETQIELSPKNILAIQIIDNRPKVPTYKPLKSQEYEKMVSAVFMAMGVKNFGWRVTFSGTLPVTNGGIGASAAAAVALARAINHYFKLNLSDDQINQAAYAGEKEVHGTPSGIDNTAATFGGVFAYTKGEAKTTVPPQPQRNLWLVIADSGRPTNTKQVLNAVHKFKSQDPPKVTALFERYTKLFEQAHHALAQNDLVSLGRMMSQNHLLLQELGVSSPELDYLVACAQQAGALGAKLTGTGCGGLMIALAPNAQIQENIARIFNTAGFFTIISTINFAQ